jgi:CHAT domain-containing protein
MGGPMHQAPRVREEDVSAALDGFVQAVAAANQDDEDRDARDAAIAAWDRLRPHLPLPGRPEFTAPAAEVAGTVLLLRYHEYRQVEDLEGAMGALRLSMASVADPPASLLRSLAEALLQRYEQFGDASDLDEAIAICDDALRKLPADAPERPDLLDRFAVGHHARFLLHGNVADLGRAVDAFEAAGAVTPDDPERLPRLHNHANGLVERYKATGQEHDLGRAIELLQQIVIETMQGEDPDPSELAARLNSFGTAVILRYDTSQDPGVLSLAIKVHQDAVDLLPEGAHDLPRMLSHLANDLVKRYDLSGSLDDLTRAIEAHERAVAGTSVRSPRLPVFLVSLADALVARYARTGDTRDLARAVETYRRSCEQALRAGARAGLIAAHNWGSWATQRRSWPEAVEAYRLGLRIGNQLLTTQLLRSHKEVWLRENRGMASRGAYALARTGDPQGAVLMVEQHRALLLSEALERDRAELDALRTLGHGDLADRYHLAADLLDRAERAAGDPRAGRLLATSSSDEDDIRHARAELTRAVEAIRAVPGYERFLDPPTFQDVTEAATAPLVYLMAGITGGMALVVGPGQAVRTVWLPALTGKALAERTVAYLEAGQVRDREPQAWLAELDAVTRWLWDAAMGSVLEAVTTAPQATLVPVGLLGLLPLHAAWTEDPTTPTGRRYALDALLLGYAPNARALRTARELAGRTQAETALAVFDPDPVDAVPLPHAAREVDGVAAAIGNVRRLHGGDATRDAVRAHLQDHQVLHFACHGWADRDDPLDSGLLLAGDEALTVRELMELRPSAARLAVLSACESAVAGTDLPDEVIGLPTGMLQAGVAGVVGSLWSVADASTMVLVTRFYELWRGGLTPAEALRRAQQWVRDANNGEKHDRFPDVPALAPPEDSPTGRRLWADGREHRHPHHWAAFTYVGV